MDCNIPRIEQIQDMSRAELRRLQERFRLECPPVDVGYVRKRMSDMVSAAEHYNAERRRARTEEDIDRVVALRKQLEAADGCDA